MTDDRIDQDEPLDDEFHSSLEIDDSSGWRVFIVPGVLLLFLLGAILFIVLSQGNAEPDPRVAEHLKEKAAEKAAAAPAPLPPPVAAPATAEAPPAAAPADENRQ